MKVLVTGASSLKPNTLISDLAAKPDRSSNREGRITPNNIHTINLLHLKDCKNRSQHINSHKNSNFLANHGHHSTGNPTAPPK